MKNIANTLRESMPAVSGIDPTILDDAADRIDYLEQQIRHFIYALDRGYLNCKDDSAFIDALRESVA